MNTQTMLDIAVVIAYVLLGLALVGRRVSRERRELPRLTTSVDALLSVAAGFLLAEWWAPALAPLGMLPFFLVGRRKRGDPELWRTVVFGMALDAVLLALGAALGILL